MDNENFSELLRWAYSETDETKCEKLRILVTKSYNHENSYHRALIQLYYLITRGD